MVQVETQQRTNKILFSSIKNNTFFFMPTPNSLWPWKASKPPWQEEWILSLELLPFCERIEESWGHANFLKPRQNYHSLRADFVDFADKNWKAWILISEFICLSLFGVGGGICPTSIVEALLLVGISKINRNARASIGKCTLICSRQRVHYTKHSTCINLGRWMS